MNRFKFRVWVKSSQRWYNGPYEFHINDSLDHGLEYLYVVQQFSGIELKSGALIYEGDYISVNGLIFVAEWQNHGFVFRGVNDPTYVISLNSTCDKEVDIKIIGNILEGYE